MSLDDPPRAEPLLVAIWDTGIDTTLFEGRLWANEKEIAGNGKDDDANEHVDDVHGIGLTWNGQALSGDLRAQELSPEELARSKQHINGFLDAQAGIDSADARE